jgi:hypothetical protein
LWSVLPPSEGSQQRLPGDAEQFVAEEAGRVPVRDGQRTGSCSPCLVPTTRCSLSSMLPMKNCTTLATSIGRSARLPSKTVLGPVQAAQRRWIRLSALDDPGLVRSVRCTRSS